MTNAATGRVLRLAVVSMKTVFTDPNAPKHEGIGDIDANLERHRYWLDKALEKGAEFIGFPEFAVNGWSRQKESALGLTSAPIRQLEDWARKERIYIATGFVEKRAGKLFNSCLVAGPHGRIGVMRKVILMADYFTPGRTHPVFEVAGVRMGIAICADATYMENFRLLSFQGAEVIFAPHANTLGSYGGHADGWTDWRNERWPLFARENCVAIAGVNNAGMYAGREKGPTSNYCGGGLVMDWSGQIVKRIAGKHCSERLLVADIDIQTLRAARQSRTPFKQFRPEILYNSKGRFEQGAGLTRKPK